MKFFKNRFYIHISFNLIIFVIIISISLGENIFINIKKLSSKKYSVILYDGLYIYNSNFTQEINKYSFTKNSLTNYSDNILFQEFNDEYSTYFIDGEIINYNANKNIFENFNYNNYEKELRNYYNLIPYDIQHQKLKLILIYEKEYKTCKLLTLCLTKNIKNKITFSFGNINSKGLYEFSNSEDFEDNIIIFNKLSCHAKHDFSQIKCLYFSKEKNYYYLSYIIFKINSKKFEKSNIFLFKSFNIKTIDSSISDNNNILFCLLLNSELSHSYCYINNWSKDIYRMSCTLSYCENIKVIYFKETKQFAFICKKTNKFEIFYINDTKNLNSFKCNKKDTIFINCNNGQKYNGAFSLIYNNSIYYYNIITDYNFTKTNPKCSFNYPEKNISIILNESNIINHEEEEKEKNDFLNVPGFFEEEQIMNSIISSNEENIEISPEYILNNKNEIIKQINIGENIEMETKVFKLTIHPTNSSPPKNTTYVEFSECEQLLRNNNNISNSSIITFFQLEEYNENPNALIKQIKYSAYDENKEELDLSLCEDIETQIHYAIKNNSNLNISSINGFKSLGYDILNIKDKFFTDLCQSYSDSGNDMILSDRIKFLYKNYSLCEEGCSYNNIDIENMMILCDCKIQGNISTITKSYAIFEKENTNFFDSNIGVIKCYNLVFNFTNKSGNIGFIIFLIMFIIYIIFIVIYFIKGIKPVKDYLFKEMEKKGYIEENNINKESNSNPIKKTSNINITKKREKEWETRLQILMFLIQKIN